MSPPANPRAHVGRDSTYSMIARWPTSFNPRARVGRDPATSSPCARHCCFNPRARVGRDPCTRPKIAAQNSFNPRARVGRDQMVDKMMGHAAKFQSTRPRGARPRSRARPPRRRGFNPRARVGRDPSNNQTRRHRPCFNPRARVGRDAVKLMLRPQGIVSIHAPAWGATFRTDDLNRICVFQSTRPRGARPCHATFPLVSILFQSTRPRGARPLVMAESVLIRRVSIHAPAWGATAARKCYSGTRWFQSTRPRGARLVRLCPLLTTSLFQSTRPRGARPWHYRRDT